MPHSPDFSSRSYPRAASAQRRIAPSKSPRRNARRPCSIDPCGDEISGVGEGSAQAGPQESPGKPPIPQSRRTHARARPPGEPKSCGCLVRLIVATLGSCLLGSRVESHLPSPLIPPNPARVNPRSSIFPGRSFSVAARPRSFLQGRPTRECPRKVRQIPIYTGTRTPIRRREKISSLFYFVSSLPPQGTSSSLWPFRTA